MGRATLAETGGERFRIRGKRMLREKAAMKLKWNHRKSKDIREKFAALAQAKYEANRKKAEAYRKAQSFGDVSPQVAADEAEVVRKAEAEAHLDADLAVREVQADTWTWTLGRSLRDFKPVGRGASGEVFFATFEGLPVAVKLTKGRGLQAAATGIDVQEEFAVLTALGQHPNVVRAFAVVTSSLGRPGLVLERASESLHAKARRLKDDRLENSPAGRASLLGLFSQFDLGLSFVHGRSVMHLDVKPANILVFDDKRAALADFGHAEGVSENGCSVVGDRVYTLDFRCPECLMVRVKFAADVWAAAATLFEVCCPRKASLFSVPPGTFVRETEEQTAKAIREMATARSFKLMPYDQTMQDILEKTFVPAEKRLSLPGLLRILDKERSASRSIGRPAFGD
ncbi:AUR3 [Symbiodinium sp. CCMP2592]|nr:AUR3 [Symbiodinium sp. CCMP2592]